MYDSIFIEERNKPTVTITFQYFANDARSGASSKGMPVVRLVPEPIVSECTVMEEIESGVSGVMDDIVAALTKPLTAEEKSPKPKEVVEPSRIIFKGNLQEVNRFFYQRGWTDGLPIIPPTEEAVAEMLTGTDLSPDHLVAKLEPRLGKATVERIAINAVMAGALPTYMPLLIAGVKTLISNRSAVMMAASTGSFSPFWIVNGPIRNDLHINSSYGAMNPGDIANATIGRAMGLITKNIRGVRKQIEDMGVLGNPMKYTMVIAENEEGNPWEPLHVEYGFKKEDSTITLTFPQSYQQIMPYASDDKGILNTVIYNTAPLRMGLFGILLTPTNAKALASKGWKKKDIKAFIMENTRVPLERHQRYYAEYVGKGSSKETAPLFASSPREPDPIRIYVVGGFGSWMGLISGGGIATEKVELPANWSKLVAKYKNIVPAYVMY